MSYNVATWSLPHQQNNAQINSAILNGVTYTIPGGIILNSANLVAVLEWLNSLGFGAIFYGSYSTDSATLISTITIATSSNDQLDSSLVNKILGETNQSEFDVAFTFEESSESASEILDSLACVMANYKTSFCESCKCDDICRNRKSANIMKATLLMRELELPFDSETEFQDKLAQYAGIIKTLCQCS